MKTTALLQAVATFAALTAAHEHAEHVETQEPFIGWTQEDLDAKWGTDVCRAY